MLDVVTRLHKVTISSGKYQTIARDAAACLLLQVCAVTRGGAFAEEVCLNEGAVLKLPPGVDIISAAGVSPERSVPAFADKSFLALRSTWRGNVMIVFARKRAS